MMSKTVDEYLDEVDYDYINNQYVPTEFAISFVKFIEMVNGGKGEENVTPAVHLKMLEGITGKKKRIANLCHRGLAKTTVFAEYLFLYIAVFGSLPGFGEITGALYLTDSMDNGGKNLRKNIEHRYDQSDFLKKYIAKAKFTENYLEFENLDGHKFGVKIYGAKSGIRGSKIFGKRPNLAVLDDLVDDEDAKSATAMETIKNTVYKGVFPSLHPRKSKIIFNGTPFNKNDILYEAVESGAWYVNVYPICEKFPCTREEFKGSWEDRFDYDFVKDEYETLSMTGESASFYQEYMLMITSQAERLVPDSLLRYYDLNTVVSKLNEYNVYVTTEFSFGGKSKNDYSVICVWAYSYKGEWYLIDGWIAKKTVDAAIDELFNFHSMYNIHGAGIEVSGQQQGIVSLLQKEMMTREIFFNLASSNNGQNPGIRPNANKESRFNLAIPLFINNKIYFPREMKDTPLLLEMFEEIRGVMKSGFKSKNDDCLDNVSMLAIIDAVKPDDSTNVVEEPIEYNLFGEPIMYQEENRINRYII